MNTPTTPQSRVSKITVGRLHNLGNYEHVRYEVTVELPPGTAPASVVRDLEDTLRAQTTTWHVAMQYYRRWQNVRP